MKFNGNSNYLPTRTGKRFSVGSWKIAESRKEAATVNTGGELWGNSKAKKGPAPGKEGVSQTNISHENQAEQ